MDPLIRALVAGPVPPETHEEWVLFFERMQALAPEEWKVSTTTYNTHHPEWFDSSYCTFGWDNVFELIPAHAINPWMIAIHRYLRENPKRQTPRLPHGF